VSGSTSVASGASSVNVETMESVTQMKINKGSVELHALRVSDHGAGGLSLERGWEADPQMGADEERARAVVLAIVKMIRTQ
jgi:hypothetical protein